VVTDLSGTILRSHVVEHGLSFPRPGWVEQDAEAVWWGDVVALCRHLLSGGSSADRAGTSAISGSDIAGVAVSAIGPCLVPLDERGTPLRPGILYGVDNRAVKQIDELNATIGEDVVYQFSNMVLSSQAVGPKIAWLRATEPDVWRRTKQLTTANSYLVRKLTGESVMDRHIASHYMPLYDPRTNEWSERYAEHIAPLELLPRLGWSDEVAGTITATAAATTGLRAGTPVAVGAVDAIAEAISVGAVNEGDLMVMYGSTTFFVLTLPRPIPNPSTWSLAGPFAGQHQSAAGMATTGSLTRWFRDELARDVPAEEAYGALFSGAARVPPGSDGLLVLPYFSGERTPINDPNARGVIAGLSLTHSRDHLFRAVLEGVAFGVRHNLDAFSELGAETKRVVAVGGGTKGGTWVQIVSDVSGRTQLLPEVTIGASYGDAFLAGLAGGSLTRDSLSGWVRIAEIVEPRKQHRELYDRRYRDYLELYRSTADLVHRL
jgi:xylulokinase